MNDTWIVNTCIHQRHYITIYIYGPIYICIYIWYNNYIFLFRCLSLAPCRSLIPVPPLPNPLPVPRVPLVPVMMWIHQQRRHCGRWRCKSTTPKPWKKQKNNGPNTKRSWIRLGTLGTLKILVELLFFFVEIGIEWNCFTFPNSMAMLTHTLTHHTESNWIEVASRVPVISATNLQICDQPAGTKKMATVENWTCLQVTLPFGYLLLFFLAASTWFFRNVSGNTGNFVVSRGDVCVETLPKFFRLKLSMPSKNGCAGSILKPSGTTRSDFRNSQTKSFWCVELVPQTLKGHFSHLKA